MTWMASNITWVLINYSSGWVEYAWDRWCESGTWRINLYENSGDLMLEKCHLLLMKVLMEADGNGWPVRVNIFYPRLGVHIWAISMAHHRELPLIENNSSREYIAILYNGHIRWFTSNWKSKSFVELVPINIRFCVTKCHNSISIFQWPNDWNLYCVPGLNVPKVEFDRMCSEYTGHFLYMVNDSINFYLIFRWRLAATSLGISSKKKGDKIQILIYYEHLWTICCIINI